MIALQPYTQDALEDFQYSLVYLVYVVDENGTFIQVPSSVMYSPDEHASLDESTKRVTISCKLGVGAEEYFRRQRRVVINEIVLNNATRDRQNINRLDGICWDVRREFQLVQGVMTKVLSVECMGKFQKYAGQKVSYQHNPSVATIPGYRPNQGYYWRLSTLFKATDLLMVPTGAWDMVPVAATTEDRVAAAYAWTWANGGTKTASSEYSVNAVGCLFSGTNAEWWSTEGPGAWAQIDMGAEFTVDRIDIADRVDPAVNFVPLVELFNNAGQLVASYTPTLDASGATYTINVSPALAVRRVRVTAQAGSSASNVGLRVLEIYRQGALVNPVKANLPTSAYNGVTFDAVETWYPGSGAVTFYSGPGSSYIITYKAQAAILQPGDTIMCRSDDGAVEALTVSSISGVDSSRVRVNVSPNPSLSNPGTTWWVVVDSVSDTNAGSLKVRWNGTLRPFRNYYYHVEQIDGWVIQNGHNITLAGTQMLTNIHLDAGQELSDLPNIGYATITQVVYQDVFETQVRVDNPGLFRAGQQVCVHPEGQPTISRDLAVTNISVPGGVTYSNITPRIVDGVSGDVVTIQGRVSGVVAGDTIADRNRIEYYRYWDPRHLMEMHYAIYGMLYDYDPPGDGFDNTSLQYYPQYGQVVYSGRPWVFPNYCNFVMSASPVDPAAAGNQLESVITGVLTEAGADPADVDMSDTGMPVSYAKIIEQDVASIISDFKKNAMPPNYLIHDELGPIQGRYYCQKDTPDWTLRAQKNMSDSDTPDVFTSTVVTSSDDAVDTTPACLHAAGGWTTIERIFDGREDTYTTGSGAYLVFKLDKGSNTWYRGKPLVSSLKLKFQGRVKYSMITTDEQAALAGPSSALFDANAVTMHPGLMNLVDTTGQQEIEISDWSQWEPDADCYYLRLDFDAYNHDTRYKHFSIPLQLYQVSLVTNGIGAARAALTDGVDRFPDLDGVPFADNGADEFGSYNNWRWDPTDNTWYRYAPTAWLKCNMVKYVDDGTGKMNNAASVHRNSPVGIPGLTPTMLSDYCRRYQNEYVSRGRVITQTVVYEPHLRLGDTVQLEYPDDGTSMLRMVWAYERTGSTDAPAMELSLVDYGQYT